VSVEPPGPYDPSKPSTITFTISNINIVPLRNVQVGVGVCSTEVRRNVFLRGPECNGPLGAILTPPVWKARWLDVDERWQIALEEGLQVDAVKQIENADIAVAITYTPWWMPTFWHNTKEFRFSTKKRSDGRIYWVPIPLTR
jgi:hypothetical protein